MKPVSVILVDNAEITFRELLSSERKSDMQIVNSIKQKIELIKLNPHVGDPIAKGKIPKKYLGKGFTNLFRLELTGYWRLLYYLKGSEVEIVAFVLDIVDRPQYNKLFGYKKK